MIPAAADGDYLTISIDSPLSLAAGTYGWTVASTDAEMFLDIRNDADNAALSPGELIRTRTDTGAWQDRNFDMVFAIDGRLVPEPSAAILTLVAGLVILRWRRNAVPG